MFLNQINIFFILILLVKCNKSENNSIYRIPISLYKSFEDNNEATLIQNIFFNFLYLNLSIGTPPQIIPFHLDINSQSFYVSKKFFNRTASSTYEQISKNETLYSHENVISGYDSKDILNINGKKKTINFIFETKHDNNIDIGCIGLLIPTKIKSNIFSFSASLIKAKFIQSFIWTFKFYDNKNILDILYNKDENNIIGELIIGDYPHNYEENKKLYDRKTYKQFKALWSDKEINWDINFNYIFLTFKDNQTKLNKNSSKLYIMNENQAELNPDIGFIVGPSNFYHYINIYFFQKYRSICNQYRMKNTLFRVIECQNTEFFNISSFPDVSFEIDDITFNLTYKDVFILDKNLNKYIFLILQEGYIGNWVLGRLFLKKYQFIFNEHSKTLGYYKSMSPIRKENMKDKIIGYFVSFCQIIFIIFIIGYIIYEILNNCMPKKRKKRRNELESENVTNENLLKDKKDINYDNENNLEQN